MQLNAFRRPALPSSAVAADTAFEPECFDFVAYFARRLGVSRDLGLEVLGHRLRTYEPAELGETLPAPSRVEPDAEIPSGVRAAVVAPQRTGTDG